MHQIEEYIIRKTERVTTHNRPNDHKTENILKSKFETSITFAVVLLMNQNLKDMFKSTFSSYLQIIKTVCPIKIEIFKI